MNNSKQETISDIVAEMRRLNPEKFLSTPWYCEPLPNRMRSYADRIEEAHRIFYDKYKEHTNELNRQILELKHEKEMSDTYFCGYDPEEALVMQCSTCRFFQRKHQHCTLNDSLTNARYKCSGWKFKTNKECADKYNASRNHEVAELREENARLRAALKPVLDAYISQDNPSEEVYDSRLDAAIALNAVREAKRIYEGGVK